MFVTDSIIEKYIQQLQKLLVHQSVTSRWWRCFDNLYEGERREMKIKNYEAVTCGGSRNVQQELNENEFRLGS